MRGRARRDRTLRSPSVVEDDLAAARVELERHVEQAVESRRARRGWRSGGANRSKKPPPPAPESACRRARRPRARGLVQRVDLGVARPVGSGSRFACQASCSRSPKATMFAAAWRGSSSASSTICFMIRSCRRPRRRSRHVALRHVGGGARDAGVDEHQVRLQLARAARPAGSPADRRSSPSGGNAIVAEARRRPPSTWSCEPTVSLEHAPARCGSLRGRAASCSASRRCSA